MFVLDLFSRQIAIDALDITKVNNFVMFYSSTNDNGDGNAGNENDNVVHSLRDNENDSSPDIESLDDEFNSVSGDESDTESKNSGLEKDNYSRKGSYTITNRELQKYREFLKNKSKKLTFAAFRSQFIGDRDGQEVEIAYEKYASEFENKDEIYYEKKKPVRFLDLFKAHRNDKLMGNFKKGNLEDALENALKDLKNLEQGTYEELRHAQRAYSSSVDFRTARGGSFIDIDVEIEYLKKEGITRLSDINEYLEKRLFGEMRSLLIREYCTLQEHDLRLQSYIFKDGAIQLLQELVDGRFIGRVPDDELIKMGFGKERAFECEKGIWRLEVLKLLPRRKGRSQARRIYKWLGFSYDLAEYKIELRDFFSRLSLMGYFDAGRRISRVPKDAKRKEAKNERFIRDENRIRKICGIRVPLISECEDHFMKYLPKTGPNSPSGVIKEVVNHKFYDTVDRLDQYCTDYINKISPTFAPTWSLQEIREIKAANSERKAEKEKGKEPKPPKIKIPKMLAERYNMYQSKRWDFAMNSVRRLDYLIDLIKEDFVEEMKFRMDPSSRWKKKAWNGWETWEKYFEEFHRRELNMANLLTMSLANELNLIRRPLPRDLGNSTRTPYIKRIDRFYNYAFKWYWPHYVKVTGIWPKNTENFATIIDFNLHQSGKEEFSLGYNHILRNIGLSPNSSVYKHLPEEVQDYLKRMNKIFYSLEVMQSLKFKFHENLRKGLNYNTRYKYDTGEKNPEWEEKSVVMDSKYGMEIMERLFGSPKA